MFMTRFTHDVVNFGESLPAIRLISGASSGELHRHDRYLRDRFNEIFTPTLAFLRFTLTPEKQALSTRLFFLL